MTAAVDFAPPADDEPELPLVPVLDDVVEVDVDVEGFDVESDVLELAPSEDVDEDAEEVEDSADDAPLRESVR